MSQDELAEKLGISRQSVSLWETGQSQPTVENIIALTKIFNISVDTLLGDSDNSSDVIDILPEKAPDGKKKNKTVIISACAIAFVMVVGAVILFAFSNKEPNKSVWDDSGIIADSSSSLTGGNNTSSLPEKQEIDTSDNVTSGPESSVSKPSSSVSKPSSSTVSAGSSQVSQPAKKLDLFTYCKNFAIKKGTLNGDYSIYQQSSDRYGGRADEYFSVSYWAGSDMVEFCLHCPLSNTYSINFYLRMRGGYNHKYEYLSSRYYRDNGESVRDLSGYIDPSVFSDKYPLKWDEYNGDGGIEEQNNFLEESRVGICDLIRCLKEFVKVENMECSFSDFEFVNF